MPDVGVDDAAVADNGDALAGVARDRCFDCVDGSLLELVARLGVWVDVPVALVEHAFADGVEQLLAEELQRGLFGRNIAKDLDLAQVLHMLHSDVLMTGNVRGGLGRSSKRAGENGVDRLERKRLTEEAGLQAALLAERRVDPVADRGGIHVDLLLAVADQQDLGYARDAGEERLVEYARGTALAFARSLLPLFAHEHLLPRFYKCLVIGDRR